MTSEWPCPRCKRPEVRFARSGECRECAWKDYLAERRMDPRIDLAVIRAAFMRGWDTPLRAESA